MFDPQGPSLRELAVQALSSVEHGYDLLAPKFDHTPFRTPDAVLDAVERELRQLGPFDRGLDLCCGTGAGTEVLRAVCRQRVTGVDFSAGMLAQAAAAARADGLAEAEGVAEAAHPTVPVDLVRGDAFALPFAGSAFDLLVSFGAFGHFLPRERPALFAEAYRVLGPGGRFVFPIGAPPPIRSRAYWMLLGFDAVMKVRNAVWRPPFVMYYRGFGLAEVCAELTRTGFEVSLRELTDLGRRADGSPRARAVVATKPYRQGS
ncbi:class I SAM-dependent methyltransferase [Streptomyces indicus]|uniref:Methyltransferase domain-containing protein n=1 Tax=Streptomyces indicus TaxID=417292 RepID=A0A1G8UAI1_9ACTN|nr:class I SAM-dependent methyltransferase [Streptomyces indicus]SDJ50743.1 Methyltransferase domain-containing protein [Streptomyces indicus]